MYSAQKKQKKNIMSINWMSPGKFEWNLNDKSIFKIIIVTDGGMCAWIIISCELVLWWMSLDLTDD